MVWLRRLLAAIVLAILVLLLAACGGHKAPHHPVGLRPTLHRTLPKPGLLRPAALPDAVDLSQWAPPVGDQGNVNSCVSWAVGHGLMGWLANRYGGSWNLAPMYTYVQLDKGQNQGTYFNQMLDLAKQGIAGVSSYPDAYHALQDYQYRENDPTYSGNLNAAKEQADAQSYKLPSWSTIFTGRYSTDSTNHLIPYQGSDTDAEQAIKAVLASGRPIVIGVQVWNNFEQGTESPIGLPDGGLHPTPAQYLFGTHAIVAYGYSGFGLKIENQWGTNWGQQGWAWLSWEFVNHLIDEAYTVGSPPSPPPPPPKPRCYHPSRMWRRGHCWKNRKAYVVSYNRAHPHHHIR